LQIAVSPITHKEIVQMAAEKKKKKIEN